MPPTSLSSKTSLLRSITGRHQREKNADQDHDEPQTARDPYACNASWDQYGVWIIGSILAVRELDHRREHIQEGNEVENDGGVDHQLIGAQQR